MSNNLKHTRLWPKTKIAEDRWADVRIPEITPKFPKTSEDFPIVTKVLGIREISQRLQTALRIFIVITEIVVFRCKSKLFLHIVVPQLL